MEVEVKRKKEEVAGGKVEGVTQEEVVAQSNTTSLDGIPSYSFDKTCETWSSRGTYEVPYMPKV